MTCSVCQTLPGGNIDYNLLFLINEVKIWKDTSNVFVAKTKVLSYLYIQVYKKRKKISYVVTQTVSTLTNLCHLKVLTLCVTI